MRYFFHVKDGHMTLDTQGVELRDITAVKKEALQASLELIEGMRSPNFWTGEPWTLWVTNDPSGSGKTLLALNFAADVSERGNLFLDSANDHLTDTSGPH
jgi:hypothetical protein